MVSIQCDACSRQTGGCNRLLYTGQAQQLDIKQLSVWLTRPRWEIRACEKKHPQCTAQCYDDRSIYAQCRIFNKQSNTHQHTPMRDETLGIIFHPRECTACHQVVGLAITDVFKPELFAKWCSCLGGIDELAQYCKRSVMIIKDLVHTKPLLSD